MCPIVEIQLFSSLCAMNEGYIKRLEACASALLPHYTIERVTDPERLRVQGIELMCCDAYCMGCKVLHASYTEQGIICAPALVINGAVVFANTPPDDKTLRELLAVYS